jgi:hypothetical protein
MRAVLPYLATVLTFGAGFLQKWPCHAGGWPYRRDLIFSQRCYSDLPVLFTGRGLDEGYFPYAAPQSFEYPVLTGYLADVTARLSGSPSTFFLINLFFLLACSLVTVWATIELTGRVAAGFIVALSPVLAVTGTINWDMLPVMLVALAMLAWAREKPLLAGIAIGLGTAAKLYPALLLLPIFLLAIGPLGAGLARLSGSAWPSRLARGRGRGAGRAGVALAGRNTGGGPGPRVFTDFLVTAVAAVFSWFLVNLPVLWLYPDGWMEFWRLNEGRQADFGSIWYAFALLGYPVSNLNVLAIVLFGLSLLAIAFFAPRRLEILTLLTVAAFLLTNKVYSPQYVLWLLPLVVVAGAPLLMIGLWQLAELGYWWAVWGHLDGSLTVEEYALSIFIRVIALVLLCVVTTLRQPQPIMTPWSSALRSS